MSELERIRPGESLTFQVVGEPKPGGSKTIGVGKNGQRFIRPANKGTKPWMNAVAEVAVHEWGPRGIYELDGPVILEMVFFFPRPQSHYSTKGGLKPSAPLYPHTGPADALKLGRSTEDALAGIVFTNDRRCVEVCARREYGSPARCEITVTRPRYETVGEQQAIEQQLEEAIEEYQDSMAQLF